MARCTSAKCKSQLEEVIGQASEERRLVQSQVVNHAAKVAAMNSNLIHGIIKTLGEESDVPYEVSLAVMSTLRAEIDVKKKLIAQSHVNLQQRERMFDHPLNDNRSMMTSAELHEWRSVHRRLAAEEGRRVKALEKEIIWLALGRDIEERDEEYKESSASDPSKTRSNAEEEVTTDTEMEVEVDHMDLNSESQEIGLEHLEPVNHKLREMLEEAYSKSNHQEGEVVVELEVETMQKSDELIFKDCRATFCSADQLMSHAKVKHIFARSTRLHCPSRGCNFVLMRGGVQKLESHVKSKHEQGASIWDNTAAER